MEVAWDSHRQLRYHLTIPEPNPKPYALFSHTLPFQNIFVDVAEIGPTNFSSTPRLWNKLFHEYKISVQKELTKRGLSDLFQSSLLFLCSLSPFLPLTFIDRPLPLPLTLRHNRIRSTPTIQRPPWSSHKGHRHRGRGKWERGRRVP